MYLNFDHRKKQALSKWAKQDYCHSNGRSGKAASFLNNYSVNMKNTEFEDASRKALSSVDEEKPLNTDLKVSGAFTGNFFMAVEIQCNCSRILTTAPEVGTTVL